MSNIIVSTVIPTIARAKLDRAVKSVLCQDGMSPNEHEVIVVNDSGKPLCDFPWLSEPNVRLLNTHSRERSTARNTGSAIACGDYLHFLDDDDWLSEDGLSRLLALGPRYPSAEWLYGSSRIVSRSGQELLTLDHQMNGNVFVQVMAGEWIPLQASLVNREFFLEIGGFRSDLSGPEDIDLLRRVALIGSVIGLSHPVVNIEIGEEGSSTDYAGHSRQSRRAREEILMYTVAWSRLKESARRDPFWWGRIARLYLTSAVWNAQNGKWISSLGRMLWGLYVLLLAGDRVLAADYWRAVLTPYQSESFSRGFHAAEALQAK